MRRFRFILPWIAAVILALPSWAQATRADEVRTRGVLRVGTTGDYQPFSYRANARSPFVGLDIELAGRLAKSLGVRLELVPTTWANLLADLHAQRFDVAMGGVSISAERSQTAAFSLPYLRDGKTPIARCEDRGRFQTLAEIDRPGVRVIVNPGGTNERFARAQLRQATISVWPDNVTIFDRIVAGEADVMITDAIETRLQQRLRPQLCAVHPETPFNVSEKAYLLPRDEAWKAEVDGWLRPIVEDGELGRLLDRWLDHPWPRAAADAIDLAPLCRVIGERLAVMPDVARYKWNAKLAIDDPARERQLLAIWRISAVEFGISPEWAEPFMRAQIEAAKVIQRELFAQWERAGQGALADAPDLATVIRPRLDALTPRLLRELAMAWPALSDPGQRERIRAATKTIAENAGVSPASAAVAAAPLNAGLDP